MLVLTSIASTAESGRLLSVMFSTLVISASPTRSPVRMKSAAV
jgi:hypothetical protein